MITASLNLELNMTCKMLDYSLDTSTTGLDLIKRNFSNFTFPVEQVQTVYRLLVRADPSAVERLCLAISEGTEQGLGEEEKSSWFSDGSKRKDETSRVLVYNSYIYPTLGMTSFGTLNSHRVTSESL